MNSGCLPPCYLAGYAGTLLEPGREDRLTYQAENYRKAVEACLSVPACTDILVWQVQDRDGSCCFVPYDDPAKHLFDRNFEPKPAYFAVRDALLAGRFIQPWHES